MKKKKKKKRRRRSIRISNSAVSKSSSSLPFPSSKLGVSSGSGYALSTDRLSFRKSTKGVSRVISAVSTINPGAIADSDMDAVQRRLMFEDELVSSSFCSVFHLIASYTHKNVQLRNCDSILVSRVVNFCEFL
jgi:hypothetical protein